MIRREEGVVAEPGEIREANVLVGLMRGDALHGQDRGVLFAEDGKLGFRGERSAFFLPEATYTVRRTELGATILDVVDGSTLFLASRQKKRLGGAAMTAVLVLAGRDAPTDDVVEWPSLGPIGKRKIGSHRRVQRKVALGLLVYLLVASGFIGFFAWRMRSEVVAMSSIAPLCAIFRVVGIWRMPSPIDPAAKQGVAPIWSLLTFASLVLLGGVIVWRLSLDSGKAAWFFLLMLGGGAVGSCVVSLLFWIVGRSLRLARRDGEARAIEEEVRDVAS